MRLAARLGAQFDVFDRVGGAVQADGVFTLDDARAVAARSPSSSTRRLAIELIAKDGATFRALATLTGRVGVLEADEIRVLGRDAIRPMPQKAAAR